MYVKKVAVFLHNTFKKCQAKTVGQLILCAAQRRSCLWWSYKIGQFVLFFIPCQCVGSFNFNKCPPLTLISAPQKGTVFLYFIFYLFLKNKTKHWCKGSTFGFSLFDCKSKQEKVLVGKPSIWVFIFFT